MGLQVEPPSDVKIVVLLAPTATPSPVPALKATDFRLLTVPESASAHVGPAVSFMIMPEAPT